MLETTGGMDVQSGTLGIGERAARGLKWVVGLLRGGTCGFALGAVAIVAMVALGVTLAAGGERASRQHVVSASAQHRLASAYSRLPLSFEPNLGQANSRIRFLTQGGGFALGLTNAGPVLALYRSRIPARAAGVAGRFLARDSRASVRELSVGFVGVNAGVRLTGAGQLPGRVNYLIGNDRRRWHTNVATFSRVTYRGVWRGIDAAFSGSSHSYEYVFTLAPGANPRQIELRYHGQSGLRLDRSGDLLLAAGPGRSVRQLAPRAYQLIGGQRRSVSSRYLLTGNRVAISLGAYDHRVRLVIDPTLDYSTYLGGTNNDYGTGIAVDASGGAYITGYTSSTDFPTLPAPGAYQPANGGPGSYDAFVSKLKPDGSALVYSTYLGGGNSDQGQGIAVDTAGSAYVTGYASSNDFPTTSGAYRTTSGGYSDAFVSKLKPDGSGLSYSTYLGGDGQDIGYGIAIDTAGSAYITGDTYSTNLPTTAGAYQTASTGSRDAFVSKLKPDGSGLVYSTYLGGGGTDYGNAIAIDSSGSAYVTGYASSTDFPITAGAYQTANAGGVDAFVSKLKPDGSALVYSTYLGGTDRDAGSGIAVDGAGSAYVTGSTSSTGFPTSAGAYQTSNAGGSNAFVSKLKPDGSGLSYSTYLGGSQYDWGNAIAVDGSGGAYITGHTSSPNFPTTLDAYQRQNANDKAFISKLSASGAALAYSTFLGGGGDEGLGIAIDAAGSAYITGNTYSSAFPTTAGAYQTTFGGAFDAFVAKLTPPGPALRSTSTVVSCVPGSVTVGSASTCTATVSDSDAGAKSTPVGTVSFVSDFSGAFTSPGSSCSLTASGTVGVASCGVVYTPSAVGSGTHKITGSYGGDSTHVASSGSRMVNVQSPGPVPPPPPGRPSATITAPTDGASYFWSSTVNASYSCSPGANGGVLKPGTAGCSGTVPNGSPIDTLTSGTHAFTVTATDTDGQTTTTTHNYTLNYNQPIPTPTRPQRPVGTVFVNPRVDIRVTGIEVTQGVQAVTCNCAGTLPNRIDPSGETPGRATYQGVTMAAGKYTVVRVYAHFTGVDVPGAASLPGATARLRIFDSHEREISPELSPVISPSALTRGDCPACVTEIERADLRAPFTFLVPWNVTYHRSLSFRATVSPPIRFGAPVRCGGCNANVFTLRGVPFATTAEVPVYPIPLTLGGVQTSKSTDQVFDSAATVLPVNLDVQPYEPPLAVDGLPSVSAALARRASDDGFDGSKFVVGVAPVSFGFGGSTDTSKVLYGAAPPISYVADDDRHVTGAMHEIGHGLGLVHADTGSPSNACPPGTTNGDNCGPHPDGTADCGGNSYGQKGETWPPGGPAGALDNEGRFQGIGLDLRSWPWRTIVDRYPNVGNKYYDFMSYCGDFSSAVTFEADHWISVPNWNRLVAFHPAQALPVAIDARSAGARVAGETPLRVIATVDAGGGTSIFDVAPGRRTLGRPTDGSPYRFELRDATGATLASVVPATTSVHNDGHRPELLLEATLPFAPSTAVLVVSAGGVELARRARSAHAPTVVIVSPRRGSSIGRSARTLVRWRASDRDGDRLTTTVEYSPDAGRHWKVVASTSGGDSVSVPSRFLSASRHARVRVRVSDGFDVATATSGVLRAAGARPVVHIIGGAPGRRMRADGTLLLRGEAFDDAGRQITGRRLAWYDGRRFLGSGKFLTARNLPTGRNGLRLVATDALGRSSRALLPLSVLAPSPSFLVARGPRRVAPTARQMRIVVASAAPATLSIGGKRYLVNRRPRTIAVSIRRGPSILRLAYVLSGRGGTLRGTYLLPR